MQEARGKQRMLHDLLEGGVLRLLGVAAEG